MFAYFRLETGAEAGVELKMIVIDKLLILQKQSCYKLKQSMFTLDQR